MAAFQALAMEFNVSVLCLHHLRKGQDEDPLAMVSGTNAIVGASDVVWVLQREQSENFDGSLYVVGRDVEEKNIAMRFDSDSGLWVALGDADAMRLTESRQAIKEFIREQGKPVSIKDVAAALDINYRTTQKTLYRMVDNGELDKGVRRGTFILPPHETGEDPL